MTGRLEQRFAEQRYFLMRKSTKFNKNRNEAKDRIRERTVRQKERESERTLNAAGGTAGKY